MANQGILGVKYWRESRGISLVQIAADTKLSMRFLGAIEDGEFSRLPGGVYDVNYIRQYARAIQFDESQLLDCYQAARSGAVSGF